MVQAEPDRGARACASPRAHRQLLALAALGCSAAVSGDRASGLSDTLAAACLQVVDHVCKLAKKGLTPSQIGVILRDSHGIAQASCLHWGRVMRRGGGAATGSAAA